jgi:multidrug efflux pump subunit AcrB
LLEPPTEPTEKGKFRRLFSGLAIAFIVLALFAVALTLTGVLASWLVGDWLLKQFHREHAARWARMLAGALAVSLLISLPLIGALFGLLVVLGGLGALLLERRAALRSAPAL